MIKFIIAKGIGFTPGSIKYIVTHGFSIAVPPASSGLALFSFSRIKSLFGDHLIG